MKRALYTALTCLAVCLTAPSPASAQDSVEEREADMFGAPEETDEEDESDDSSGADDGGGREAEMFGSGESEEEPSDLEARMLERLDEKEEASFDIGGEYFGRTQVSVLDEGGAGDYPYTYFNILDLYADGRPNERLRVFAQGRLTHTPTVGGASTDGLSLEEPQQTDVALDQLYVNFDIARAAYVTAGKQEVRWGVGRFWYPNDFLQDQRLDPLTLFDERTGLDLVRIHVPFEELGWNVYAVADVQGADSPDDIGAAGRAEFLFGTTELAVSGYYRKDRPLQLAADVSTGVWLLDLRAGVSVSHDVQQPFVRGDTNLGKFDVLTPENIAQLELPETFSREDDWIPHAVLGGELSLAYGDEDTAYIGAEYFFNDFGTSDPDHYPVMVLNGTFRPLYAGRHYAAVYALLPAPGEWNDTTFTVSTLGNISDRSLLSRLDYSVTVLTQMRLFVFGEVTYGEEGELRRGFELPGVSQELIEAAEDLGGFGIPPELSAGGAGFPGVDVPPTRFAGGLGLSLDF